MYIVNFTDDLTFLDAWSSLKHILKRHGDKWIEKHENGRSIAYFTWFFIDPNRNGDSMTVDVILSFKNAII